LTGSTSERVTKPAKISPSVVAMAVMIQLSVVARASSALDGGVLGQLVEDVDGLADFDIDGVLLAQQRIAHDCFRTRAAFLRLDLEQAEGHVKVLACGLDRG
jgi:hypothetical protein